MVVNSQAIQALFVSYSIKFNKALTETTVNYQRIAMVVPSSTRETTYAWLGQAPEMREWLDSRTIQNLNAYDYTIKNRTFEMTTKVPVNDIADDQYGIYGPLVSEMGRSAKKHPDELVFELLGNGFKEKCYDGKPFFSTEHPTPDGTQSNMGTGKLNPENYALARCSMMTVRGDKGKPLNIIPDLLVVAPQNEAVARELLFADLIAGTSNVNKGTCELLVVPELAAYPDQWYLLCTNRYVKPFVFQDRERPKLVCKNKETDDNVFFDDEIIYGIKARYNAGFGLWQLAYGSTGEDVGEIAAGSTGEDAGEITAKG